MKDNATPRIIVRVTRPDLTPEEREKRMAEIKRAATQLVKASMIAKRRTA